MASIYTNTLLKDTSTKNRKYGVTERKKATLDQLSNQVLDAENEVEQLQAIVQSLTEKSNKFSAQLSLAEQNRKQARNNMELGEEVGTKLKELKDLSNTAFNEVVLAKKEVQDTAQKTNTVINKLIYSAEVINKLSNLVIRKKAMNPLISDDLVSMITKAGSDANNAVALTLTALKSVFASQATILESEATLSLEYIQAVKLVECFTGVEAEDISNQLPEKGVLSLLQTAYTVSEQLYKGSFTAFNDTVKQLNAAQSELNKANVKLSSLQSGLAAANAAALAS
ncbi:hypothetical protein P8625_00685 [Tenacibaculum tangerinum]|uniref:Uncharacterized protein n=1 Tax=Tenacibaculum tangerinum TaxID=3038772 RepID=A0ABY8L371_9FLAO|nr:hypothetical protein [Tenacibaculum tangerinum]WGH75711.1 hypothetical protein P8625_00685 [Tenacibaculum tangerinum]